MGNPIRERILTDNGWVDVENSAGLVQDDNARVANLESQVSDLRKKILNRDKHWESVRDTEKIKLIDERNALRGQVEQMRIEISRLEGKNKQLQKEVKDLSGKPKK